MTERLYLQDAYMTTFAAAIVERVLMPGGRLAVVLDRTAFYPGQAGLRADRGWLSHAQVSDLALREGDGEILHVLTEEIWQDQVQGKLDWPRRIETMRYHTAGHLLAYACSQVCVTSFDAAALNIVMTEDDAWLELGRADVSPAQAEQAEAAANEIALENRAVRVATVDAAQAARLGLALPLGAAGALQAFSIEGTPVTTCQGVHVARTGELGLIKVTACERRGKRTRLHFVCGARVLAELRQAEQTLDLVAGSLGVSRANAPSVVKRLTSEWQAAQTQAETLRGQIVEWEAEALLARAEAAGSINVVRRVYAERDVAELRQLAQHVIAGGGCVALLGTAGSRAQLVFARSSNVSHDMTVVIRVAAQVLNAQGGGQAALAETLPVRADEARVQAALAKAVKVLQGQR